MNRKIMIVGFILMAIGLLVLSNAVGLMTVTYPEPDDSGVYVLEDSFPCGNSSNPSVITAGQTTNVNITIGTNDREYRRWTIEASILPYGLGSGTAKTTDLHFDKVRNVQDSEIAYLVTYRGSLAVPSTSADQTYQVNWAISSYQHESLASFNTYCKASSSNSQTAEQPDGDFTINGQPVDSDDNIIADDGKLAFSFTPTAAPDDIGRVYIEVWNEGDMIKTVYLSKSGGSYSGSYELPDYGIYTLKGFVQPRSASSLPIQTLSIIMDNSSSDDNNDIGDLAPFIGVGLVIGGIMVISSSRRK